MKPTYKLISAVQWAKTCMHDAVRTVPGSLARDYALEKLRGAIAEPRRAVDEILSQGRAVPRCAIIDLRACELAVPKLEAGTV